MLIICHCKLENLLSKQGEKVCFSGRDYMQVFIYACFRCQTSDGYKCHHVASLSLFWCVQDYGDGVEIDGFDIDYGVREIN